MKRGEMLDKIIKARKMEQRLKHKPAERCHPQMQVW